MALTIRVDHLGADPHPDVATALDLRDQRRRQARADRGSQHHRHIVRALGQIERGDAGGVPDPDHENMSRIGRPIKLVDGGQVIHELLG